MISIDKSVLSANERTLTAVGRKILEHVASQMDNHCLSYIIHLSHSVH